MKKILIDNCTRHHAVALRGEWKSNGIILWGDKIPIETGKISTELKPIQSKKISPQAGYIARLAYFFMQENILQAYTSDALKFETFEHPCGQQCGINYGDFTLMEKVSYKRLLTLGNFSFVLPLDNVIEKLRSYLNNYSDPLYKKIRNSLPAKSSQDAWHLFCVDKYKLDLFLTTDATLIGQIRSIKDRILRNHLLSIISTPEGLCSALNAIPMTDDEIITFAKNKLEILVTHNPPPI